MGEKEKSMDIAKQIVDQRINKILDDYSEFFKEMDKERAKSKAFLLFAVAAYLDIDIVEAEQYITDGSGDGGFDAVYIEEAQDSQLNVVLFQSKYSRKLDVDSNFPTNAVEKAVNTVKWVFDPDTVVTLNKKSKAKVEEIRSFILDGYIPFVTFVMLNNGLPWNASGQEYIDNAFADQQQVRFEHFSHLDILNYINKSESINAQIYFSGKAVQEDFNYKRVIVGRVCVNEIYKLMEENGDKLLEKNIRRYLGKNTVNEQIEKTLLSEAKCQNFFFYNNGITMICEKFGYNGLQEKNWTVKMSGLQIINGGQSCKTIYQTIKDHPDIDFSQVYILVRLYEVNDDEDFVNDITYATNSQNPVDFRDLKSNDKIQKLLEESAKDLGYIYKRKRDNIVSGGAVLTKVIPSSVAAEAIFAIWRGKPYLAKYKKNEFFNKYYEEIFENINAAQMILAVIIFRYCDNIRKKISDNDDINAQRPFSQYFLAYMIGQRLLKENKLTIDKLTHENFEVIKEYWDNNKTELYREEENRLIQILNRYFDEELIKIDGRTMAAVFRRFDILYRFLKNE